MIVWVSIALFLLYLVILIIVTARWHKVTASHDVVTIKNRPSGVTASHDVVTASHDDVTASHDSRTIKSQPSKGIASHVSIVIKNQPSKVSASHDNVTHWKETLLGRMPRGGQPTLDKPDILPWETEPERLPLRMTVLHDLDYIPAPTDLAPKPQVPYSKSVWNLHQT